MLVIIAYSYLPFDIYLINVISSPARFTRLFQQCSNGLPTTNSYKHRELKLNN